MKRVSAVVSGAALLSAALLVVLTSGAREVGASEPAVGAGMLTALPSSSGIVLGAPVGSIAQSAALRTEPSWRSGLTRTTHSVAWGDVDGDGDLDLACGNSNQVNTVYTNDGGVLSTSPSWSSGLPTNNTTSVAWGDVDGDGDLDLAYGNSGEVNTVYANEDGVLSATPTWSSGPTNATQSIAWGDVDGDGDLDLACGNSGHVNTVYTNAGGLLSTTPTWSSDPTNSTTSVAWGDVDGDGDLDLACGNFGNVNMVYMNEGGVLSAIPTWSSSPTNQTYSVAWGDVDGDGDLDLACGNFQLANTVYLNEGGVLSTTPLWSSGPTNRTQSVTWGDVDGDGDLDLACGNSREVNTVYTNEGGVLSTIPAWSSDPMSDTRSVAWGDVDGDGSLDLAFGNFVHVNTVYTNESVLLSMAPSWSSGPTNYTTYADWGDVDGDGDLDLACGNSGVVNTVYANEGGVLSTTPSWSSGPTNNTRSIAWGDVDGDGDLDLACGNDSQVNTLYANEGGVLSTTPSWSSGPTNATQSVAWADVDGDGDLDLACGNDGRVNTIYANEGGVLSTSPSWSSGPKNRTFHIAWGDMDGDGDLDLACGNWQQRNTAYLNEGGVLSTTPTWLSGPTNRTTSVAWGDVNGDGDQDLACGNSGQLNTVYLNEGGVLSATPTWLSGPTNQTQSVAWGDVDSDGDLDLACGNFVQVNTAYLNEGGVLSTSPSWSSGPTSQTFHIAWGDVDGDGDLDLACANVGAVNTVYLNPRLPPFSGLPSNSRNHVSNSAAHLRWAIVERDQQNEILVSFKAIDVESDPIRLAGRVQFTGRPTWYAIPLEGLTVGTLATSPTGVPHSAVLNTRLLPSDNREMVLQLRTVEVPQRVSLIQYAAVYSTHLGRVMPQRPELATSSDLVEFASVTVGDTVEASLILHSAGSEPLIVSSITTPSLELEHGSQFPMTIPVGESHVVHLQHAPINDLVSSGMILIDSNDPLTPVKSISTQRNTKALSFTRRLVPATQPVPLGEPLAILVTPADFVHIEKSLLHLLTPDFEAVLPLLQTGPDFSATILGELVTEAGLEYWVEVRNDPVVVTDPPGAPDSVHSVSVQPATIATSQAVSTTGFADGSTIRIDVEMQRGAKLQAGTLYYRQSGAISADEVPLQLVSSTEALASIPGESVGPRGIEYWVRLQTAHSILLDPPAGSSDPHRVRTAVRSIAEENVHSGGAYRMVSIPLDFGAGFTGTLETLLAEQPGFGTYDPTRWRSFVWVSNASAYLELVSAGQASSNEALQVQPGRAFWLVSRAQQQVATRVAGQSTPTDTSFAIVLSPGWNQIGNPFAFAVSWTDVELPAPVGAVEPPLAWRGAAAYEEAAILEPFDGYFVMNNSLVDAIIRVPPVEALAEVPTPIVDSAVGWRMALAVVSAGETDVAQLGVAADASAGWDVHDRSDPPGGPERGISLYFPHDTWPTYSKTYASDVRPPTSGQVWRFDIAKSFSDLDAGDEARLSFGGVDQVPEFLQVILLDHQLDREVNLRTMQDYNLVVAVRRRVPDAEARFTLVVGDDAFVDRERETLSRPMQTHLLQNWPNPFRRGTVIRYHVAHDARVDLRVFDVRGRLVRNLESRTLVPGRYELAWDGKNSSGSRVPAGVYLYRMRAEGFTQTRKMLLIQ